MAVLAKNFIKRWKQKYAPQITSAKEHYDFLRNELKTTILEAEEIVEILEGNNGKLTAWKAEEKRLAKLEEDRKNAELQRQRDEQAEQERKDRAAQAIADRKERVKEIQAMLKRKEITKAYAARLLKEAGAEEEARIAQAEVDAEAAKAAPPPQVTVKANIPSVAGTKSQTFYFAEVTNPVLIIAEFAMTTDPERRAFLQQFIIVDAQEVGVFARKTKNNEKAAKLLPGVKFTSRG